MLFIPFILYTRERGCYFTSVSCEVMSVPFTLMVKDSNATPFELK